MKIISKIPTKIPVTLVSMFFFVLILGFASPAHAYTNEEIVDYINTYLSGASDAEIAAVASSYGVSASDISNAYQEVSGVDVSARAEEAFEQVVTVTVNDTNYYTTVGESANVYTAPTADAGGASPIGTFNTSTGQFTNTNGATANITDITESVTVSATNTGGTVTTTVNGQAWDTVVGATTAGLTYLSCAASGATGCLSSYLNNGGANVSITSLTASQRLSCIPGTIHTVLCSDHAGTLGISANSTIGNATYSVDSCGILTTNISGCSAPGAPTITSFTATPKGFSAGGGNNVTLSWTTVNATSCTLTGGGLNLTGDPRSVTSYTIPNRVTSTATYTLTCSGPGGTTSQ